MEKSHVKDTRQMGITHADFFRLLPRAMGENPYDLSNCTVRATLSDGSVVITLGEEKERKLSALVIMPYADVTFDYYGVPEEVRAAFERHFHLRYMRGLG